MAIDALIRRLERETDERVAAVMETARASAASLLREAELVREQGRASKIEEIRREYLRNSSARRARVTAELRREVLAARHRLLERVSTAARGGLPGAECSEAWFAAVLDEALRYTGEGAVVRCRPRDGEVVRRRVGSRASVVEDPEAAPGLLVSTADGRLVVDATLTTRLEALRPRLARAALDALGEPS